MLIKRLCRRCAGESIGIDWTPIHERMWDKEGIVLCSFKENGFFNRDVDGPPHPRCPYVLEILLMEGE